MKTVTNRFSGIALAVMLSVGLLGSKALASNDPNKKQDRKVAHACAAKHEITLAPVNSMSKSDLAKIHTCVKNYRYRLHECATKAGITAKTASAMSSAEVPAYRKCQDQVFSEIE